MKYRIIIFFLWITSYCYGQDYTPLLELNKTWNMFLYNDTGDSYSFDIEPINFVEIEGQTYYQIVASHNGCTTYLREDPIERKVYGISEGNEYLHYDFSKNVGDSIWVLDQLREITSIEYGDFYGMENLRFFVLDNVYKLIEGIGFETYGIIDAFEYGCLHVPIFELVLLSNMNQPLSIEDNNLLVFNVYPNPVNSSLFVSSNADKLVLKIFNLLGQVLFTQNIDIGTSMIDLSFLDNGAYLMIWESTKGNGFKRIIKN